MDVFRLVATTLSLALLAACGGGGAAISSAADTNEALPALIVVDAQSAMTLVGGGAPPTMTPTQAEQAVQSILSTSNKLMISDITDITGARATRDATCNGVKCELSFVDGSNTRTTEVSLADFSAASETNERYLEGYNGESALVMTDTGVTVGQSRAAGRFGGVVFQFQVYGGWLMETVFSLQSETETSDSETIIWLSAYSFGNANRSNPTGTGKAVWNGVVIGADKNTGHVIHGDALLDIDDLASPEVDISFTDIKNLNTGGDVDDMNWEKLGLDNGTFNSETTHDGEIEGVFYGAGHAEVGGIFDKNDVVGAFGAARE